MSDLCKRIKQSFESNGIVATIILLVVVFLGFGFVGHWLHGRFKQVWAGRFCREAPKADLLFDFSSKPAESVESAYYLGIEIWMILRLLIAVALLYAVAAVPICLVKVLLWLFAMLAFMDMVHVVLRIHLAPKEVQKSSARSLFALAMHYLEAAVFFGTCFVLIQGLSKGHIFKVQGDLAAIDASQAFYFSFVTISTLGFGDVTPASWTVQFLIVPEILLGMFILIVGVGRVLDFRGQPEQLRVVLYPDAFRLFYTIALEYYVAARAALLCGNSNTTGTLLHHAVELLLKGQLSKTIPLEHLKDHKKFGHKLSKLWAAFKDAFPTENLAEFDAMIKELDRFEKIRYPDEILDHGAIIGIGFGRGKPVTMNDPRRKEPEYQIGMADIDAFCARVFPLCGLNPKAYFSFLSSQGRQVLTEENTESNNWLP